MGTCREKLGRVILYLVADVRATTAAMFAEGLMLILMGDLKCQYIK